MVIHIRAALLAALLPVAGAAATRAQDLGDGPFHAVDIVVE